MFPTSSWAELGNFKYGCFVLLYRSKICHWKWANLEGCDKKHRERERDRDTINDELCKIVFVCNIFVIFFLVTEKLHNVIILIQKKAQISARGENNRAVTLRYAYGNPSPR